MKTAKGWWYRARQKIPSHVDLEQTFDRPKSWRQLPLQKVPTQWERLQGGKPPQAWMYLLEACYPQGRAGWVGSSLRSSQGCSHLIFFIPIITITSKNCRLPKGTVYLSWTGKLHLHSGPSVAPRLWLSLWWGGSWCPPMPHSNRGRSMKRWGCLWRPSECQIWSLEGQPCPLVSKVVSHLLHLFDPRPATITP